MRIFTILLLLISNQLFSQNSIDFTLVDKVSKKPISFASISFIGSTKGTVSNENGEVNFSYNNVDQLIKISAIGYLSREVSVNELDGKDTLHLESSVRMLKEVVIKNPQDSAYYLLLKAFENMEIKLKAQPHSGKAFFRNCCLEDAIYQRMLEVAFDYYENSNLILEERQVSVEQMRRTDDHRNMDWEGANKEYGYEKNDVFEILRHDPFTTYTNFQSKSTGLEHNNFSKNYYNFYFDSIYHYDGHEIIKISAVFHEVQDQIKGRFWTNMVFYIRMEDFFIYQVDLEVDTELITNLLMRRRGLNRPDNRLSNLSKNLKTFTDNGKTITRYVYQYEDIGDFAYTKAVRHYSAGCSGVLQNNKIASNTSSENEGIYKQYAELLVYEVNIESPKPIAKRKRTTLKQNLYRESYSYNKRFWDNFKVLPLVKLDQKAVEDLETDKPMLEQFKNQRKLRYDY
ncbi:MAG: carboxypeptidase-like regulatory domain-containing protein [Cyclobacteriaceae bacterium]|nr:carboxypeptidase-like regulatory domain-containing protein [Cyclobacteriaceae bacterium]MCH8516290.1 carboxypeptidase-like regulatory domain-containing protein [Cyclobacteriaceae bacterium]